jgi:hypothetical protein
MTAPVITNSPDVAFEAFIERITAPGTGWSRDSIYASKGQHATVRHTDGALAHIDRTAWYVRTRCATTSGSDASTTLRSGVDEAVRRWLKGPGTRRIDMHHAWVQQQQQEAAQRDAVKMWCEQTAKRIGHGAYAFDLNQTRGSVHLSVDEARVHITYASNGSIGIDVKYATTATTLNHVAIVLDRAGL